MKKLYLVVGLFLVVMHNVGAQAPGGVEGVQAWFKTEAQGDTQYHWKDYGGDLVKLNTYNSSEFFNTYSKTDPAQNEIRFFNFNPALNLGKPLGTNDESYREFTLNCSNLSQTMIFGAFAPTGTTFDAYKHLYTVNGRPKEGFSVTTDEVIGSVESEKSTLDYGSDEGSDLVESDFDLEETYREGAMRLMTYYRMNQPNYSIWGEKTQANISLGDIFNPDNIKNTSEIENQLNDRKFSGYIPELIIYGRYLNPLERRKVESYLALKYGLTIEKSYLASNGDLLWDLATDTNFNNRITAIIKDETSGLDQPMSTTTYEEAPAFSDANDSYFEEDNAKGSSNRRLLTIESSSLQEDEFAIWGDNDKDLSVQENDQITNLKMMNRNWLLKTNRKDKGEGKNNNIIWSEKNNIKITSTPKGYTFEALKPYHTTLQSSNAVTKYESLDEASIEFSTELGDVLKAGFYYKKYEDRYVSAFSIYKRRQYYFIATQLGEEVHTQTWIHFLKEDDVLKISKDHDSVYFHYNGDVIKSVAIKEENKDRKLYGEVAIIDSWDGQRRRVDNVVLEGFPSPSDKVELSYDTDKAEIFNNLINNTDDDPDNDADQIPYLIIDRSGKGTYRTEETDIIKYSSIDTERKKIIFDGIFWNTDEGETGEDMFTFGQKESNLIAIIEGVDPTCEGEEPLTGTIKIEVKEGEPVFRYTITDIATQEIVKEDKFGVAIGNYEEIPFEYANLKNVEYDLVKDEIRMINLSSSTNWGDAMFSSKDPINGNFELSWSNGQNNKIVLMGLSKSPNKNLYIDYGLYFTNSRSVFPSESGAASTANQVNELTISDEFKVKRESGVISYYVNDELIKTSSKIFNDPLYIDGVFRDRDPVSVKNIQLKRKILNPNTNPFLVNLPNILPGTYDVLVEEIDKTNFTNEGSAILSNATEENEAYLEYQVKAFTEHSKQIGFTSNKENAIEYGIEQRNDSVFYKIGTEVKDSLPIELDDIIRIKKIDTDLVYELNNVEIYREVEVLSQTNLYGKVEIENEGTIENVKHEGFALADWEIIGGTIEIEEIVTDNFAREEITITAPVCDKDSDGDGYLDGEDNCPNFYNPEQKDDDGDGIGNLCDPDYLEDKKLTVSPVPSKAGEEFTIDVDLEVDSDVSILIYDLKGRLLYEGIIDRNESTDIVDHRGEDKKRYTVKASLDAIGLYIVKVLSNEGELTKKITID